MSATVVQQSTLDACKQALEQMKVIADENARRQQAWDAAWATYNVQIGPWLRAKEAQDAALRNGHYAPANHIWNGNSLFNCSTVPHEYRGPFWLCGYYPELWRKCRACGYKDSQGQDPCNCASCAERCCFDCSPQSALRYNGGYSHYQHSYNWWIANNPQPKRPPDTPGLAPIPNNITCAVCTQSIVQGTITAASVQQDQINQAMQCLAGEQQKLLDAKAAEAEAERLRQLQLAKEKAQQTGEPDPRFPETIAIANAYWREKEIAAAVKMIQLAAAEKRRELEEQEKYAKDVSEVKRIRKELVDNYNAEVLKIKEARERITAKFGDDLTQATNEYNEAKRQKMMIFILILVFIVITAIAAVYFYISDDKPQKVT